uniref:Uncharacterized protein n=1 Tax=Populus alba TaxID=43335 RepID=A0A4U5PYS6_POPAL|nr:hypothetical protein D5086_0000171960 [Populus alba]
MVAAPTRPTAWRDVTIPATVPVTRSKPLGALGLLIRGCGRARTLICQRSCQPIGSPNAPNGLARRHDSGHRPRDPLQAVGRVGAAYPRRGRGALTSRARSKVLAADARLSACRDVPVAVAGIPARHPLQAVGRVGAAYPRSRAWGLNRIPLDSPRAKVLAAPTRPTAWRDVTAAVASACARKLEAWPTCLVRTAELGDCEESCTAWACRIQLLRSCQGAGSPRHPQAPARCARCRGLASVFRAEADGPPNDCPCCSPPRPVPSRSAASPAACCVSLRDPPRPPRLVACPFEILRVPQRRVGCPFEILSRPAVRARSLSGVSICPRGRGSLVGIVVACTQSRMSGNWAVRVGRLRACAPNCRPAAPITLSPRPWVPCGEAGFLCCVPTSVEFECEAVPLRRAPPRGRGANLAAAPVFQSSGIPPNWPTRGRSCFRMRNAMPARGPPPLRPSRSSRSCSIRTTSSPVSAPRLIGVGDRAGRGVAKECYLVDPASSHMLVSKIKPCMYVNAAAQELEACTQMRIRQRAADLRANSAARSSLCKSRGSTWHDLKLGRRTVQGRRMTQQADEARAGRWGCHADMLDVGAQLGLEDRSKWVSKRCGFLGRMTRMILRPNQRIDLGGLLLLPRDRQIQAQ